MGENIIAHDIDNTRTKDVLIGENVSFQTMFLSPKTLEGLTKCGFQKPSPIQLRAIPLGRCGFDLIVKSKSGTGKTIVFSIVALEMIDTSSLDLQVLILAPTREIAVQIADTIKAIGISFSGLNVNSFIGGLPEKDDKEKARNCQIAVGAPGRLKSLIKQNILNVANVKLLVLDEADKLMEESFKEDVNEIYHKLSIKKQVITASATYPDNLKEFLSGYMQSPTYVSAENDTQLLLGLKHFVREVKPSQNSAQEMKFKNAELLKLLSSISFTQCIIFSNYQTRAENISISINRHGWNSMFISAAQTQEKRLEAINNLKNFKCRILLSTDLTARGIDASNIDLVINYDVPIDVSTYLHRMGRAGRYGSKGVCITLISGQKDLIQIRRFLGNIGGTQLTIAKLNDIENGLNDLWSSDDTELEKISGIIEENEDVTHTIKNEILSLKKCSSDEGSTDTEQTKDYEDMKKDSKLSGNNKKSNSSRKKLNKKNTSMEIMEKDNSDVNTTTSSSQSGLVAGDDNKNAFLQSLAKGTFDFASMSVPENNESVEDNVYTNTCLQSLANGTFDFSSIPSPKKISGSIDEFPIKNDTIVQAITEIENQYLKSPSLKNEEHQESRSLSNNCTSQNIEKSLENDNISGCKKKNEKTRTSSVLEAENEGKACKNEVYIKNKGIYEVARILNSQAKPDSETELNLSNYLNILENCTNDNNKIKPTNNECIAEQNSKSAGSDQIIHNIFSHAYKHAVEIVDTHWKCILKDDEKQVHQNRDDIHETNHMEEDYEDDDMEEDYMDQEVASEVEMIDEDSNMEYDENGYINIPNRMVWVPVEENTLEKDKECPAINLLDDDTSCENIVHETIINPSQVTARYSTNELSQENSDNPVTFGYNHHFSECFQTYSDLLWNQGLKFSSTEEFDEWYNGWLQQVSNVREYVRQNIYVKEMSQYQNGKRNF